MFCVPQTQHLAQVFHDHELVEALLLKQRPYHFHFQVHLTSEPVHPFAADAYPLARTAKHAWSWSLFTSLPFLKLVFKSGCVVKRIFISRVLVGQYTW